MKQYIIHDLDQLKQMAESFAADPNLPQTIFLSGPIGVGKSSFAKFFIEFFGFKYEGSPTFTLINYYDSPKIKIVHCDAYRDKKILDELLLCDCRFMLIEWPGRKLQNIFNKNLNLCFKFKKNCRIITEGNYKHE